MQTHVKKLWLIFLVIAELSAQSQEIDRLMSSELKMTFPSIYFKHNSTDYAAMPYTADSCFKYIAQHIKDINSFVIWRDSMETEALTDNRIKKLRANLNPYTPAAKIRIRSMHEKQKISRHTMDQSDNTKQKQYLLSLNSVLDIAKAKGPKELAENNLLNHRLHPKITCWNCWKHGFHLQTRRKLRKAQKEQKQQTNKST